MVYTQLDHTHHHVGLQAFAWLTCALFSGSNPGYLPVPDGELGVMLLLAFSCGRENS